MTSDSKGVEAYYLGCIIKYLYRFEAKNGIEDLRKAQTYLRFFIDNKEQRDVNAHYTESGTDPDYEQKYNNQILPR